MRTWLFAAALIGTLSCVESASAQSMFSTFGKSGNGTGSTGSFPSFTPFMSKPSFGGVSSKPNMPVPVRSTNVFSAFPNFRTLFASRGGPTSQPQVQVPPPPKKK